MKFNTKRSVRSIELEKRKIIFQFTLMLIGSLICALLFTELLGEGAINSSTERIVRHFSVNSEQALTLRTFSLMLLRTFCVEIFGIIITFVFSFSYINYLVSDVILIFLGFRYGLNAALVKLATFRAVGIANSLSFWVIGALQSALILYFSYRMGVYSIGMRKFSSESARTVLDIRVVLSSVLLTLTSLLATLGLGALYCLILYVF